MRWYDIVPGILILFIIDFAFAAPVLVQEKRQACVYEVYIPRDVITVSRKRGDKDLEKLLEEYFNAMGKPVESSGTHESLSTSAPPGPGHASTNVAQAPVPNPVSSTTGPNPLIEQSIPSSTSLSAYKPGLDHGSMEADAPQPNLNSFTVSGSAPQPNLNPFTVSGYAPQPNLNPFSLSGYAPQPNLNPFTLSGYKPGLDHGLTGADAPQLNLNPNSKKRPLTDPDGPDPNFNESPPRPAQLPKEIDQANEYQVEPVQQPNLDVDLSQPHVSVSEEHPPLTSAQSPTDPELHLDHQHRARTSASGSI